MSAAVSGFQIHAPSHGLPLGVAVSAGADSVALLHLLQEQGIALVVLHVDHGFRGAESEADREFVSQKAAALGLPFLAHRPEHQPGNREQAARNARYRWFHQLIRDAVVGQVATGHTRDDQAETVLFRFLRGAGTAGLSSILPITAEGIVRPLLKSRRADLRSYLLKRGLAWREDSSNGSVRFARNRIRHNLLPELERNWNPNLTAALAQTALWAQAEEEYWQAELSGSLTDGLHFENSTALLEVNHLNDLPLAAARRVVRFAAAKATGSQPEFEHVERVLALARRPRGLGSFRTKHWEARRSFATLRIARPAADSPHYCLPLDIPGAYPLPDRAAQVTLELNPVESVYNDDGQLVDWALVSGSLELRNWHPGDRFQQASHRPARKLKHFFQEAGIPSWERSGWPVITCANSILWTRGQGVPPAFAPSPSTQTVLRILEMPLATSGKSTNQKVSV